MADVGLVELLEQPLAGSGQRHGLVSVIGAMDQGLADVGLQAVKLEEEILVVEAECGRGGVDARVGGDLLEAA